MLLLFVVGNEETVELSFVDVVIVVGVVMVVGEDEERAEDGANKVLVLVWKALLV